MKISFQYRVNVLKFFKKNREKLRFFSFKHRNKSMKLHFKGKRWLSLWIFIVRATKKVNKPLNYFILFYSGQKREKSGKENMEKE